MLLLLQQTQEVTYNHFSLCRIGLLAKSEQDLIQNLVLSLQGMRSEWSLGQLPVMMMMTIEGKQLGALWLIGRLVSILDMNGFLCQCYRDS